MPSQSLSQDRAASAAHSIARNTSDYSYILQRLDVMQRNIEAHDVLLHNALRCLAELRWPDDKKSVTPAENPQPLKIERRGQCKIIQFPAMQNS